jgi:hypothetical protein
MSSIENGTEPRLRAQIKERTHGIQASKQGALETYQHKEEDETPIAAPTGSDGVRRRAR